MVQPITSEGLRSLNAQQTGEVWLLLLTITHASLTAPLRFTSDAVVTPSRGEDYLPFPFALRLPNAEEDRPPGARLRIDNVDRRISEVLRQIDSPASIRIELILASNPDNVEVDYGVFQMTEVSVDLQSVEATLSLDQWSQEPYPAKRFDPTSFRGLVG